MQSTWPVPRCASHLGTLQGMPLKTMLISTELHKRNREKKKTPLDWCSSFVSSVEMRLEPKTLSVSKKKAHSTLQSHLCWTSQCNREDEEEEDYTNRERERERWSSEVGSKEMNWSSEVRGRERDDWSLVSSAGVPELVSYVGDRCLKVTLNLDYYW